MLISFQGFGHGDSTDFKDWTDSFNRIGFRSRQLSGWFFQILDFKLRSFLRIGFLWFLSKDWIWFGFSRIGVSFGLSKDRFLNRLLDGLILLSKGLSGLVVNFGRIKVR